MCAVEMCMRSDDTNLILIEAHHHHHGPGSSPDADTDAAAGDLQKYHLKAHYMLHKLSFTHLRPFLSQYSSSRTKVAFIP